MACVSRVSCAREVSRFGRVGKCVKTKVGLTAEINFWEFFKHFSRNKRVILDTELTLSESLHIPFNKRGQELFVKFSGKQMTQNLTYISG